MERTSKRVLPNRWRGTFQALPVAHSIIHHVTSDINSKKYIDKIARNWFQALENMINRDEIATIPFKKQIAKKNKN